ncbi:tetratricopeptide repeat protein [Mariniblastus fucicola]|uniref:Beta-lactamase HcpC n=1 Tax=Mariniblastus fucicola TaxID=980251 RepID=A0A5B9P7V2_9BACT|nr:tetratricopeptide repeat protein [Mariniblastus fucicola]QEG21032.1 Putative beta-lactamase HcpC precursor [Mariniblastus fucicola]
MTVNSIQKLSLSCMFSINEQIGKVIPIAVVPKWYLLALIILSGCDSTQKNGDSSPPSSGEEITLVSHSDWLLSKPDAESPSRQSVRDDENESAATTEIVKPNDIQELKTYEEYESAPLNVVEEHASLGFPNAQTRLGNCYEVGFSVEKDIQAAVSLYRKAAEKGNARAQAELALCYAEGKGVEKSSLEAVKWYQKAAEQGQADAQNNLGVAYALGEGIEKDQKQAMKWYLKAAEQGYARAQFNLGYRYDVGGDGLSVNDTEAAKWYRKAAEQGYVAAQYNLGTMYYEGRRITSSFTDGHYENAFVWLSKAANQDDAWAQYKLAIMYDKGRGVRPSYSKAMAWFGRAANNGHKHAQEIYQQRVLLEELTR